MDLPLSWPDMEVLATPTMTAPMEVPSAVQAVDTILIPVTTMVHATTPAEQMPDRLQGP